ncbi:tyrosine-protein phosphatase non-receptor type 23-like isoform X2 [Clupea harengus]|uniref:Tyrosine-protein phosphatase non-receptor type 23-like isoform X2 n=1 Tax=Clupea harengus TaxID=7950 RepID=A0A8M1KVJ6_CLUHA|nr:tyrosine-protein phosphatase non-receptor type 23-like isoform X2 [Clupea harengus]
MHLLSMLSLLVVGLASTTGYEDDSGYPSRELAVHIGTAIVFSIVVFCCCRGMKWCCKKSNAPVTSGSGQPVYIHAPSAERQPWLQPPSSAQPWDSDPPSYDLVGPEYCYPYTPAAPPPEAPVGEGGEGGRGAPPPPPRSTPLDPGPQYQPRGWGGGLDDFLTSSPPNMDTNTDTYVYNSDKLN